MIAAIFFKLILSDSCNKRFFLIFCLHASLLLISETKNEYTIYTELYIVKAESNRSKNKFRVTRTSGFSLHLGANVNRPLDKCVVSK